jgi:hypothetical protein
MSLFRKIEIFYENLTQKRHQRSAELMDNLKNIL